MVIFDGMKNIINYQSYYIFTPSLPIPPTTYHLNDSCALPPRWNFFCNCEIFIFADFQRRHQLDYFYYYLHVMVFPPSILFFHLPTCFTQAALLYFILKTQHICCIYLTLIFYCQRHCHLWNCRGGVWGKQVPGGDCHLSPTCFIFPSKLPEYHLTIRKSLLKVLDLGNSYFEVFYH